VTKRYIVLGEVEDIDAWRRERGLSRREVVACSTRYGHLAVRGLSGNGYKVVILPSWSRASEGVRRALEQNMRVYASIGAVQVDNLEALAA